MEKTGRREERQNKKAKGKQEQQTKTNNKKESMYMHINYLKPQSEQVVVIKCVHQHVTPTHHERKKETRGNHDNLDHGCLFMSVGGGGKRLAHVQPTNACVHHHTVHNKTCERRKKKSKEKQYEKNVAKETRKKVKSITLAQT